MYVYIYLYGYGYMWAPIIDETRAPLTIRNCCVMCCFWIIVVPRTVCWHNAYYLPCDCWWSAHLVALRLDRWSDPLPRTIPRGSTWRDLEHLWRLVSAQRCARPNSATTVFHNFSERWEIPWYPSEGHVGCSCKICNFFHGCIDENSAVWCHGNASASLDRWCLLGTRRDGELDGQRRASCCLGISS